MSKPSIEELDKMQFGRVLHKRPDDWRSIETAPRDGTIVEVMDPDCGRFQMRWNPAGHNPIFQKEYGNGIWECPGNNFTWSEDEGAGPRYWRPTNSPARSPARCIFTRKWS